MTIPLLTPFPAARTESAFFVPSAFGQFFLLFGCQNFVHLKAVSGFIILQLIPQHPYFFLFGHNLVFIRIDLQP